MELKLKDKKLLLELFSNSKQSNRQLAKKIGVAKETIANRIDYLIENKYINNFSCKIDYEKLNFIEYNLFLRLKNISENKVSKLIKHLEQHPSTTWIGKSFGKYDFKISIITKQQNNKINEIISNITSEFSNEIDTIDFVLVTDKYKASPKLFLQNLIGISPKTHIPKKKETSKTNLDNLNKQIIYYLGQNPKEPITKIAQKTSQSPETIKYRKSQLEKNNIITGYSINLNGNKFNKIWCLTLLNINPSQLENLKTYLKKQEFLSSYSETLGLWNFNVTFFANNIEELHSNLNKIRTKFSENIKNFEFIIFFEIYKYPKIPKCILE